MDTVATAPLVTLVGVGGMGKTRVALEVAHRVASTSPDVWWVDFAPATNADAVPHVALAALGATHQAGRSASESVVDFLAAGGGLVVLDNCEHVLSSVRDLVEAVLTGAPDAHALATSREALGLADERTIGVGSLPSDDAATLFEARARAVRPDLDSAGAAIADICARVDGIPLAIELAAARCRAMSPAEIAARLDDRYRLLRGGRGAERHRTLQAAVGWSYDLLDPDERDVFDRMSVFAGGALLDALARVCGRDEYDVLDVVDRLVARSMVIAEQTALGTRYRQLETLRQFGEDRLAERDAIEAARSAHLDWIVELTASIRARRYTPAGGEAFRRYVGELDNLRAAVSYAVEEGRDDVVRSAVACLGTFPQVHGTHELADWFDPIPRDGMWTSEAAEAAAVIALVEFGAGRSDDTRTLMSKVPSSFDVIPLVGWVRFVFALVVDGDLAAAAALTPAAGADHDASRVDNYLELQRAWLAMMELYSDPSKTAADAVLAASEDLLDRIREQCDETETVAAVLVHTMTLEAAGRWEDAMAAAREVAVLADTLGAPAMADISQSFVADALGAMARDSPAVAATNAPAVREIMLRALAQRNRQILFIVGLPSATLVATIDPATALLIDRARERFFVWPSMLSADIVASVAPEELAAIEVRAATLTLDDLTALILDGLDRLITSHAATALMPNDD